MGHIATKSRFTVIAVAVVLGLALAACSSSSKSTSGGSASAPQTLSVYTANPTPDKLPWYVAQAQGYFAAQNVKVKFNDNAGATVANFLVSDQADLLYMPPLTGLQLEPKGKNLTFVFAGATIEANSPIGPVGLDSRSQLKTVADLQKLKSCRVAVPQQGTIGYAYGGHFIKVLGIKCNLVIVQSYALAAQGVAAGTYDLAVVTTQNQTDFKANGKANTIADALSPDFMPKYGLPGLTNTIFGFTDTVQKKKDAIQRTLKALVQAYAYIDQQAATPAGLANLVSILKAANPIYKASSDATLTAQVKVALTNYSGITPTGFISQAAWQQSLTSFDSYGIQGFSSTDPQYSYAKRVDMSDLTAATSTH